MSNNSERTEEIEYRESEDDDNEEESVWNTRISGSEVIEALTRMANGQAVGEDGIPIECLKVINSVNANSVASALDEVWMEERISPGWELAKIIPIHKDGNTERVENYRGISLLNTGYKLLTNIMINRINKCIEENKILKESKAGFRKGRGTRDHIFVLNSVIENRLKEKGGKLCVAFVDFKAAFDSIDRGKMLEKIWKRGIRGRMYRVISEIYKGTKALVQVGNIKTRIFGTNMGVRQGCALSSTLFDIFIDDVDDDWLKKEEGGTVMGKVKIRTLKDADDIAILAENAGELKKMLETLERYVDRNNPTVNAKKSKIMIL